MAMMPGRQSRSLPDILNTARVLQLIDEFQVLSLTLFALTDFQQNKEFPFVVMPRIFKFGRVPYQV
jgi:hypothetical protein